MLGLGYPILTPRAITEGGLSAPRGNGQRHRSPYSPTRSLPFGGGHQHRTMRASTSAVSLDHHLSHAAHHQGRIASYDRIIHAVLMQVCIARSAMALDTWIFCSSDRLPLVGLQLVGLHGRWQRTCRAADRSFVPRHLRLAGTVSGASTISFRLCLKTIVSSPAALP
jgi:hypothetical protein